MDWKEEPATNQQLLRLQEYGFVPTFSLTVTQAARLIRQYSKHPGRAPAPEAAPVAVPAAAPELQPHLAPAAPRYARAAVAAEPPPPLPAPSVALSETARMHADRLRQAIKEAEQLLAQSPERLGVRADLLSTIAARQQFWLDTCRADTEGSSASVHALEFFHHYGAHFFAPTWEEVQEVLDALDRAMPWWDKDHPELFYEALRINFPSLLRQR